ncbi:MAG: hypothetical protein O7C75_05095, partial [Verrucomicrobia bacterium]|nr:hypothetical protein [Verrucomicrobiota bacterium]
MNKLDAWIDRFLFQSLDARSVAWFRIAFAIVLPWFFWSRGHQPTPAVPETLHWLYEHFFVSPGHYLMVVCLCGLLAIGWRPRICGFMLFFLLLPLDFVTSGPISRQVLLFALLAFAFIPSGAVKIPWISNNRGRFVDAGPCWPVRLIQLQLTFLYG